MTGQQLTLARARQRVAATSPAVPLRLAVHGLPGVGTGTVVAALRALDRFEIVPEGPDADPDVTVRVVAEVVRPEDLRVLAAADGPALVLVTKADTCGWGPGGPVPTAVRRCADLVQRTGTPAEAMVGLLARAAVDPAIGLGEMLDTLRVLVTEPADLRTAETFLTCPHSLPAAQRRRLIDTLDLFGIAHAVVLLRDRPTATADDVHAALRRVSRVDEVAARIETLGGQGRYRRLRAVIGDLEAAAITDAAIAEWLTADEMVLRRMDVALEMMRGIGMDSEVVGRADAGGQLARARRWRRLGQAPLSALHRECAADITRGSLRLWSMSR